MENIHIEEYLEKFIYDSSNPKFGVLIKGDWGCGKTYLINKIISNLKQENISKNEIICISLYGINSIDQINEKIYQAYHPVLSSPEFQFAGRILSSALKLSTTIDLNNDGKSDGSISFGGIQNKKKVKVDKIKKKLLIVDDLERCHLPLSLVLGYFSEFILQDDIKTIFIGNEEKTNDKKEIYNFKTIKEKIIGIEFTVTAEIEKSILFFINELSLEKYNKKNVLLTQCLSIIETLKINNMRNIRQGFYNLKYLLQILPESATDEYIRSVISTYMILFLQKCLNKITVDDVSNAIIAFDKYQISFDDYNENKEKYSTLFANLTIPLDGLWASIIFHGHYLKSVIVEKYNKDIISEDEKLEENELLYLISNWRILDKEKFKKKLTDLNKKFYNFEYPYINQILHYSSIMLCFSNWKLIPETESKIKNDIIEFIRKNGERVIPISNNGFISFSYGGYALSDNTPGLEDIKKLALEINHQNEEKLKTDELKNEIKELVDNVPDFCKNLIHVNGSGKYYKIPIFSKIDIDSFVKAFISLNPDDQGRIIHSLSERYGERYSNGVLDKEYYSDYEPLIEFSEKYKSEIGEITYDPRKVIMQHNVNELEKLIEYMKVNIE